MWSSPAEHCDEKSNDPRCLVDPACWDQVLPFEGRFLEALDVHKISEPSEFEKAVSKAFSQIDTNADGCIEKSELEVYMRERIYPSCPPAVWAVTADELLPRLGAKASGERISRAEFALAVERMADTLDRRVWPLATSQFFSALMFAISQPLMPLLVKELDISMAQFGTMVAVMPLVRVALAFPATYFANRYGRKPLTVEGQLVAAVGLAGSAWITTPAQLVLSRVVIGIGTSFAGVGQQNMLGDIATGRTRSRVFAPGTMRASAAFAVGPAVGGWLAEATGVQSTFVLVGVGMAVVSLRNRFILTETLRRTEGLVGKGGIAATGSTAADEDGAAPQRKTGWLSACRVFARDPVLRAVTLANVGYNVTAISSRFVLLPMLVLDAWGLGGTGLGMIMGAMSVTQMAASRPAAYVADVYGRSWSLLPGMALTTAAMAGAAWATAGATAAAGTAASASCSQMALLAVCGSWALGSSLVGSVPSALTLDAAARLKMSQKETAQALSISRVAGDLGMIVGCSMSGALLAQLGGPGAFSAQAGLLGLMTTGSTFALWRHSSAAAAKASKV